MASLSVTVTIDDTDQMVLKNDILDTDAWVQDAVTGKVNKCWKRMQNNWTTKLINDESFTDSIPSNKAAFVSLVTSRADYKNREVRDADSNTIEEA